MLGYLLLGLMIILAQFWPLNQTIALFCTIISFIVFIYLRFNQAITKTQLRTTLFYLSIIIFGFSYSSLRINLRLNNLITQPIKHIILTGYITSPNVKKDTYQQAEFLITSGTFAHKKLLLNFPITQTILSGYDYQLNANIAPLNLTTTAANTYQQYLFNQNISGFAYTTAKAKQLKANFSPQAQLTAWRSSIITYLQQSLPDKTYAALRIALMPIKS